MQSCVHSFFFFFVLPDRPTHLHEREGDGKRNILWGWPIKDQITRGDRESLTRRIQSLLLENLVLGKNLTSKQKNENKNELQA